MYFFTSASFSASTSEVLVSSRFSKSAPCRSRMEVSVRPTGEMPRVAPRAGGVHPRSTTPPAHCSLRLHSVRPSSHLAILLPGLVRLLFRSALCAVGLHRIFGSALCALRMLRRLLVQRLFFRGCILLRARRRSVLFRSHTRTQVLLPEISAQH